MAERRLQVFHAVAKHLSFTKAAEALFMTQPAVTFQIKQLEEHLDARLFDRGTGQISLTAAGSIVFGYAERILALSTELEERLKDMTGEIAGPLLIGASMTIAEYLLPQVLGEFNTRFPSVVPRLLVGNSESIQHKVAEHRLDLGFIEGDSLLPSLVTEICCKDELQVVCAPTHPLAEQKFATPEMLVEHLYVSREPGSGTREITDLYLQKNGATNDPLQPAMELGSPEALKGVVATGFGFAIMSRITIIKETQLKQLVGIPLSPQMVRNLSVIYPKHKFQSKMIATFVEFAKVRLARALHRGSA
jgi:DNA-binding transcriptional LysR family regulator